MKINKLTLQAFGPFKEKYSIDFNKINEKKLFLISGPTGSGKTTIFDAICFALYGTSSAIRPTNTFRSDFASNDTISYVEIEFELQERTYEIYRTTASQIIDYKNNKIKSITSSASLKSDDLFIEKPAQVTEYVKNLLGVDDKQFKKIMMLPQGKFTELLFSTSKNKQELFRKIFNTNELANFTDRIKDKHKQAKNMIKNQEDSLSSLLHKFEFIGDYQVIDVETYMEDTLCKQSEEIKKTESTIKASRDKLTNIKVELAKAQNKNDSISKYNKATADKKILDTKKTDIVNKQSQIEKANVALLLQKDQEQVQKLESSISNIKIKIENNNKLLVETEEKISNVGKIKDISSINEQLDQQTTYKIKVEKALGYIKKSNGLLDVQVDLVKSLSKDNSEIADLESKYRCMQDVYFKNLASNLALELENGKPCIVCGSLEHPNKAIKQENNFTKEDIDKYQTLIDELSSKLTSNNTKLQSNIQEVSDLQTDFESLKLKVKYNENDINKELIVVSTKLTELKSDIENTLKQKELLEQLNSTLKSTSVLLDDLNEQLNEQETSYKNQKSKFDTELQKEFTDVEQLNEYLILDINVLKEEVTQYNNSLQSTITILEEYSDFKDEKLIDTSILDKEMHNLKTSLASHESKFKNLNEIFITNKGTHKNYLDTKELIESKQKEFDILDRLFQVVTGNFNKNKVNFETYILSMFFDEILIIANNYVANLTSGKYKLKRKDYKQGNGQQGLDLLVIDNYTGKQRDISTISGGESFMISLSLAIGLSEFTKLNSNSVDINTLFIDEGFGTLDKDRLDVTINLLTSLKEDGKLIGIISHVEELKSRIDTQIILTISKEGSKLTTI